MTIKPSVGKAPHKDLGLSQDNLLEIYRLMRLSRALSERGWLLQRGGKTAFMVTGEGHEAVQVASVCAMERGRDTFLPYYRDIGVAVAAGMTAKDVLLHFLGRAADGSTGGRQIPGHYFDPQLKIVSGSSVVATQIPHASGIALADKLRGEKAVTVCYFGDGAASKGDFHEGLNFAGVHRLPVIFICENNGYAISVPGRKQAAVKNLSVRARGYGFPGVTVDGNDVLAVYRAVRQAAKRARAGGGPTFIEAKTYRLTPHTSNDDPTRYRTKEELEQWQRRDPIERFKRYLSEWELLDKATDERIGQELSQAVNAATRFAEASPLPEPESALRHVYLEE